MYAEVETRIEALRELLLDKLQTVPSTLHDQKRYIRSLCLYVMLPWLLHTVCLYSTQSSRCGLSTSHTQVHYLLSGSFTFLSHVSHNLYSLCRYEVMTYLLYSFITLLSCLSVSSFTRTPSSIHFLLSASHFSQNVH